MSYNVLVWDTVLSFRRSEILGNDYVCKRLSREIKLHGMEVFMVSF